MNAKNVFVLCMLREKERESNMKAESLFVLRMKRNEVKKWINVWLRPDSDEMKRA